MTRTLVAGIGNIFCGDDGFGCAVAAALQHHPLPDTTVVDFGIRGMDLAFALTSDYTAAILVDAVARGGAPGTLYVIEPATLGTPVIDNHAMDPAAVLRLAASLGELPAFLRVVGCEPGALGDPEDVTVGLSPAVAAAVTPAAALVADLVTEAAHR
jgi:hydrogenase maturation protease